MSDPLFPRLRHMWEARDPMPPDLTDSVLVALATRGLGAEYELLTLLESTDRLAGVRGGTDAVTLTFSAGDTTVMVRVSPTSGDRRRIDGWLAPASAVTVRLQTADDDLTTVSSGHGRFEFSDAASGPARIWLEPRFATDTFDL